MEERRAAPEQSPVERRIEKSFEHDAEGGRPLSRRALRTRRSVESYLRAGVLPRYMTRLNDIERQTKEHRRRLATAYRVERESCGADRELFARRWEAVACSWPFTGVNDLIREHNDWYPVEADLAIDLRTRDYVKIRGRSYRRTELGPEWILEQFPARPPGA